MDIIGTGVGMQRKSDGRKVIYIFPAKARSRRERRRNQMGTGYNVLIAKVVTIEWSVGVSFLPA